MSSIIKPAFIFAFLGTLCLGQINPFTGLPTTPAPETPAAPTPAPPPPDTTAPPLEKEPVLTTFVKAIYPPALLKQGITGTITLQFIVNERGTVDSVAVIKGLAPALDSAVAKAATAFVFTPATAGGKPVPVLITYDYRVTLADEIREIDTVVNFSGRVVERGTRAPLAGAMVFVSVVDTNADSAIKLPFSVYWHKIGSMPGQHLEGSDLATSTDSLGHFSFKSIPVGRIVISIAVPGCEVFHEEQTINRGKALEVTYRLERVSYADYNIVVHGKKDDVEEVAEHTLTQEEVQKIPGFGGDAVKVIEALPGVARPSILSGQIIIRGSGTGDSHFYIDGVTLPTLFHFGGLTSTYNSEALQSVDLYPGGFGTRYGDAMGGVVELTGRKPKTDRYHGYIDVNLFDASFLLEGPLSDNVSFLVTARRSYIANVLNWFLDDVLKKPLPFTVVPYYWDYIARLDADLNKNNHVYITFFGSEDKLDLLSASERGGSDQVSSNTDEISDDSYFHMVIADWQWTLSDKVKNDLHYALCRISQDESIAGFTNVNGSAWAQYYRDELTIESSKALKWHAGADIQIVPYNLTLAFFDNKNNLVHDTAHYQLGPYALYGFLDWKPTPKLTLTPGIRYDYYPELHYDGSILPEFWDYGSFNKSGPSGEPSLRLSARYAIDAVQTVKGSAGTYNETPQPLGQSIDPVLGNPDLGAENGAQYVLGYERKLSSLVSADLQAYYNRQWNDAMRPTVNELADDPSLPPYIGNGLAQMHGIELLLKHDQSKRFVGWIAYSLSKSERWNYDENQWVLYNEDQTNNLQLVASYKVTPTQEAGVRFQYVTGDPTTPVIGSYYNATDVRYVPIYGPTNSARMGPYVNLDIRYEKKFVYALWQWSAYIDVSHVENWFGKGYHSPEINQYEWNYNYTQSNVLSDVTRPTIGIRMEF
jgi:TonB family protein